MKTCTVDGCGRPNLARGFCGMHYHRWERHGDPLGGDAFRGEVTKFFEEVVVPYAGDDCLVWPYARGENGYGYFNYGPDVSPHRAACRAKNGPPPTERHEAAHNCGNGAGGCCNPNHLRWATRTDNQGDRIEHGTSNRGSRHGMSKLTEHQVLEIYRLKGVASQSVIAAMFGTSQPNVAGIHKGTRWSWLTGINDNQPQTKAAA